MEGKAPIVEIEHVNKSYRRGTHTIPVLADINLDICRRGSHAHFPGVGAAAKSARYSS